MAVIVLTFASLKLSFLYLYHCCDNMILAIFVKQTTFEWSGSKKLNFDSAALTAFSSILHSKYLYLFLHFYMKLTHYKNVLFVHQVNCITFSKFDLVALSVDCPAVCSVSVSFFVDIHFFCKKIDSDCKIVHDILHHWQQCQCCLITALIHHLHIFQLFHSICSK